MNEKTRVNVKSADVDQEYKNVEFSEVHACKLHSLLRAIKRWKHSIPFYLLGLGNVEIC